MSTAMQQLSTTTNGLEAKYATANSQATINGKKNIQLHLHIPSPPSQSAFYAMMNNNSANQSPQFQFPLSQNFHEEWFSLEGYLLMKCQSGGIISTLYFK